MPELPEVETVVRGLRPRLEGRVLTQVDVRRGDLRIPFPPGFADALRGRRVLRVVRRAKYILATLDNGVVLIAHLGMSGRMLLGDVASAPALGAHDHVRLITDDGSIVTYNDARRFGLMTLTTEKDQDSHPLLAGLGPEPLGNSFHVESLNAALKGKKTPIKAALLDQKVVAGLGNIYVCEALFRSGISPKRLARTVPGARAEKLVPAIRDVLNAAIAAGGSTLRDYVQASGELGYFQHNFLVYGQEGQPCSGCGGTVKRIVQSGRSTFFCPKCQK